MTGFSALPVAADGDEDERQWKGEARILGPQWARLPTLTVGLLGVQVLWSVEMGYASPYLLTLGLTKSWMAIVFIAGPLSGLIVQPLIGVLADNSKSRFGRRRPFILAGCAVCVLATLLMGFTRQFASLFTRMGSTANDTLTIWLAVFSIYCIDFSINAVQAVDRALLVDTVPPTGQAAGNAWAARMLGVGSVAGFFVGELHLPTILPFLGSTQLEVLTIIASVLLLGTHVATCSGVKERVQIAAAAKGKNSSGFTAEIKKIWQHALTLPRVIRQICIIQFFAWLAWFPVLFYTTVYIGELHRRSLAEPDEDEGTRLGARAMFWSAMLSLATNILMPVFVKEAAGARKGAGRKSGGLGWVMTAVEKVQVHLATLWAASHAVFALCMAGTLFTSSVIGATILITITGFSWAITQWAPFSLLAEAILSEPAAGDAGSIMLADSRTYADEEQAEETQFLVGHEADVSGEAEEEGDEDEDVDEDEERRRDLGRSGVMGNAGAQLSVVHVNGFAENEAGNERRASGGLSAQAGVILGIHNIFIVIPQFLVTGLASIIFAVFEPDKSVLHGHFPTKIPGNATDVAGARQEDTLPAENGPNSVAIIFRVGGVSAAIAFVLCWRLAREIRHR